MKEYYITLSGTKIPVYAIDTVIIGTGCAGFNAADCLYDLERRDIAIITEGNNMGTSRNTGSDKQTYYKLSLASDTADSVAEMANTLFNGIGVNGDTALIEAACSVKSFIKLANLGVPFPVNTYGEYVGYKTDHDPRQRASSAGPLTSKFMTECLEKEVESKKIKIFDKMSVVKLIEKDNTIKGILAIDKTKTTEKAVSYVLFDCENVIMATGGPAGIYERSVYPKGHTGMSGIALEAGAVASNLQEWQYGLASTKFRWNVSGTYQQVLPRYISVDKDGNQSEFLYKYFNNPEDALSMVFLKGYQWPFDTAKISGSSLIDIIIHYEIFYLGNRVYMDFTKEPKGLDNGFENLSSEAYNYLKNSSALINLPIKRLEKMNKKAIELYKDHNIDLYAEPLEVSICAQHQNGGISVDLNWESSVHGLYVVGEAAGTFGVYRPGGSALNSTQVGSMRAAEHIAYSKKERKEKNDTFKSIINEDIYITISTIEKMIEKTDAISNVLEYKEKLQKNMSKCAAHMREPKRILSLKIELEELFNNFFDTVKINCAREVVELFKCKDMLITQISVLDAMYKAAVEIGSRGSGLVIEENGDVLSQQMPEIRYKKGNIEHNDMLIKTRFNKNNVVSNFEKVRPIPQSDSWFENVWNSYTQKIEKLKG